MIRTAPLVGVSGQIAAGKSTLTRGLSAHLGFAPVFEEVDRNPYLSRYYRDPAAWALRNFLFFFEQSLTDQLRARQTSSGVVQERLPQEHLEVFGREFHARGFLAEEDMALLERLAATTLSVASPPALLVHLQIRPEAALDRVRERAREADDRVSLDYLKALAARYDAFIAEWTVCPIVQIDTSEVDLRSQEELSALATAVMARLANMAETLVP